MVLYGCCYDGDDFTIPLCYFGCIVHPQYIKRKAKSNISSCILEEIDVESCSNVMGVGSPYSFLEGTKVKSQGQEASSHKDIGDEELVLQAPEIVLVPRKDQEALEKKLKKMTRHEQNLLILKKFLKVIPEKKGVYNGVFFATSFPSKADVRRVEKMVKKMATRLALVSLHEWMLNVSPYLGVKVTNSQAIGDSLFKSTAQFILHTFDMEDFERFNSHDKLEAEYKKFWKELSSYLEEDFEGFTTYDKLKSKHTLSWKYNVESEIPHNLVANGKISLDDFPSLREQDVGYILTSCAYSNGAAILMDFGWPYDVLPCFKEGCHDRFVEMARTILLQYIPREEDVKMYSILGCGRTLDAIREEAFSNIDQILELGKSDEIVAQSFKGFLASMIKRRYCILKYLCMFASYGLRAQTFGSFAKEVIELVEIADLRRRYLSHHFISKHQILWAVSLTEFKDLVDILVKDIGLKDVVEKPATHPPYNIYITARTIADIHGDYVAGVDHLVVATIFQMSKRRLRKNIIEFNNIPCVKKFIEAVREYKRKYQEHLIMVNSWDNEYLDDRSSDISSNAELGDDVDTELDDDAELDDDTELDDYCLEYVNKSKIKNLRKRKKDKNYEWGGSIRSRRTVLC